MAQVYPHLHIVLLADDFGEELWPLARRQAPACLVPADSGASDSLLSAAVARTRPFTSYPLHVVTTAELADSIYGELSTFCGLSERDIDPIIVPARHGSAFSVALACACIRHADPDAVVMVVPANQKMELDDRWGNIVFSAYQVALRDRIVLFGAQQEQRSAGVSYIRHGGQFENIEGTYEVRLFVSDARLSQAQRAIRDGAFWYTGMYMARAASVLGAFSAAADAGENGGFGVERIAETASFLALLDRGAWRTEDAQSIIAALPQESIEKAVLEPSGRLVALPVTAQVMQVSSLADLDNAAPADAAGNRGFGTTVQVESSNVTAFEQEPGRLVCTAGIEGAVVVDTADAVLVASKSMLRDMEPVFAALARAQVPQAAGSVRRPYPWGTAELLFSAPGCAAWRLELRAGSRLEAFTVPAAYGCPAAPEPDPDSDGEDAPVPALREQYAVAGGHVSICGRRAGAQALSMDAGDAFEADADDPLFIVAADAPATLVLTAALG